MDFINNIFQALNIIPSLAKINCLDVITWEQTTISRYMEMSFLDASMNQPHIQTSLTIVYLNVYALF